MRVWRNLKFHNGGPKQPPLSNDDVIHLHVTSSYHFADIKGTSFK